MNRLRACACLLALLSAATEFAQTSSPTPAGRPTPHPAWWPSPDLLVLGHAGPDMICVYVVGAVHRPGVYYLNRDATVGDAIKAAQGVTKAADWEHFCGMVRPMPLDVPQIYRFKYRQDDEKISLRDGDQIYFGHETY